MNDDRPSNRGPIHVTTYDTDEIRSALVPVLSGSGVVCTVIPNARGDVMQEDVYIDIDGERYWGDTRYTRVHLEGSTRKDYDTEVVVLVGQDPRPAGLRTGERPRDLLPVVPPAIVNAAILENHGFTAEPSTRVTFLGFAGKRTELGVMLDNLWGALPRPHFVE